MIIPKFPNYEFIEGEGVYSLSYRRSGRRQLMKPGHDKRGYPTVSLRRNDGKLYLTKIHVIAALSYLGPRPEGMQVNHKNGNKDDFSRSNLEYVTGSQNMKHAFAIGLRSHHGENNPKVKLKTEDVKAIRKALKAGTRVYELALQYGVTWENIDCIRKYKTWRFV